MALTGSDQITITDIRDSISCEISSSNGVSLLDALQGTVLTCHLYGADGEIDIEDENEEESNGEYLYLWTKKEIESSEENEEEENEEEEEFFRTGKSIELTANDLKSNNNNNSFTFYCDVYSVFLEENNQLIAHGEITLDITIKKWMEFDENSGLWLYGNDKQTAEYFSKINNAGMHIYKHTDSASEDRETRVAAFSTTTIVERIRIGNAMYINYTDQGGLLFTDKGEDLTEMLGSELDSKILNTGLVTEYNEENEIENIEHYYLEITIENNNVEGIYRFNSENPILTYSYKIKNNANNDNPISSDDLTFSINIIGEDDTNNIISIDNLSISSPYEESNQQINLSNYFSNNESYVIKFKLLYNEIVYSESAIQIETEFV